MARVVTTDEMIAMIADLPQSAPARGAAAGQRVTER